MTRRPPASPALGEVRRPSAAAWLALGLSATVCLAAGAASSPPVTRETLRLGFTYSMFGGVNENDAKASIKALAATVVRERNVPADPDPLLFNSTEAIAAAVRAGDVDAIGITTEEFQELVREVRFDRYMMSVRNGDPTEEYLVLVRRDTGLTDLASLRGKRLAVFASPRMALAPIWLDVALTTAGLPPYPEHCGSVTEFTKLSKAVLNVFFRQADAGLVTRHGYATMTELNPQLGVQLVVIAASPAMVPAMFAFRTDLAPGLKEDSVRAMASLHTSLAGQQVLTIFQVGQVAERPLAALDSALALLDEFARLRPQASAARVQGLRSKKGITPVPTQP